MFLRRFIVEPGALWPSAHAASAVALPDGRLIASWFAGSREGAPDAAIWSSEFDGHDWSQAGVLVDSPGCADGNSVLWLDGDGRLRLWYVTMQRKGWATCVVRERRSPDGGQSWSADRFIREEWGWMVRNEPLRWNGRTLMPMYDERDWSAFVLVSEDGGETWQQSNVLRARAGVIQPAIAPLGDAGLLMFLRSRGGSIYRSRCVAGSGLAWSEPEPAAFPNPNSAVELIALHHGALLAVFNASTHARTPLRVALSEDGGETWPAWRDLESGPGEYSYPTAVQTPDGFIHVLNTYKRETIAHATFDEAWVCGA